MLVTLPYFLSPANSKGRSVIQLVAEIFKQPTLFFFVPQSWLKVSKEYTYSLDIQE